MKISQTPSVFIYDDYRPFLQSLQESYPGRRTRIDLSSWAKRLGYHSPRTVAMFLKGQRIPTARFIGALGKDIGLTPEGRRYLELLAEKERHRRRGLDLKPILEEIALANPRGPELLSISADRFAVISEWYHLVMKQLIKAPSFDGTAEWIEKKLASKVSRQDIQAAISRLIRLGIFREDPQTGAISESLTSGIKTTNEQPSKSIRIFHKQMLQQASYALDSVEVTRREFQALTFRMKPERANELKQRIREFVQKINKEFYDDETEAVYQLSVQLFPHSL